MKGRRQGYAPLLLQQRPWHGHRPVTRHIFVNDRGNHRIQVFDDDGKFLYDWHMGDDPSDIHLIYIGADRNLWAFDRGTARC